MKIFIYKTLIIFFLIVLGFQLTFNYASKKINREMDNITSKENIDSFKNVLRLQMKEAVEKEEFIKKEDAELIKAFIDKIKIDLYQNNLK
jgi:hypothetical protein